MAKKTQSINEKNHWKYHERLYVPWWYLICAAIVIALLGYELGIAVQNTLIHSLLYIPLIVIAIWIIWGLSSGKIGITQDQTICVGKAKISAQYINKAFIVQPEMKSAALGRQSDPLAYIYHKGWVKPMILLILDDPQDPTPYWIFSTRRPEALRKQLPSNIDIVEIED